MSWSMTKRVLLRGALGAAMISAVAVAPTWAEEAARALCFLDSFEAEMDEERAQDHAIEMEVLCAHADRTVLDVAALDLRLVDGDDDLIEAGIAWMEAYEAAGGRAYFSSRETNAIAVSNVGRERTAELRAHSHAIPASGVARLVGTVDLVVEADCVGEGAVDPISVQATAGALRNGTPIPIAGGGELVASEQGQSGDNPMLAVGGSGSYVALVDPPEGVRDMVFFGKKRLIVEPTVPEDAPVTMRICPAETITVPIAIEAAI